MGYIKKLKNNELVGGTDKHTIYPVTSTEAVFEEVSENNFESQQYLNNHIYGGEGGRINQESITNYNIAKGTLSEDRLDTALKTKVQEGYDTSWKFKGEYDKWATYDAHDVVYDPATNSSYISLEANNQWHPVNPDDEGYVPGKWQVIMNGKVSTDANNALVEYIENDLTQHVTDAITDANGAIQDMRSDTLEAYTEAEQLAQQITDWSSSEISSTPSYTDQHPLSNRASSAQVGYFECGTSSTTQASNQIKAVTAGGYALPTSGGAVKIKMYAANTYTPTTNNPVKLQFNADATTLKELKYNGEAVSPTNTWEKDEVISVYYDGTYYQASNAQGGGGKAEKIKYDNSQGGLNSSNVQGAISETNDKIADYLFEDVTEQFSFTNGYGILTNDGDIRQGSVASYSNYIDLSGYSIIRFTAIRLTSNPDSYPFGAAFYDSSKTFLPNTAITYKEYAGSAVGDLYIVEAKIPQGAKYIRITWWASSVSGYSNFKCMAGRDIVGITKELALMPDLNTTYWNNMGTLYSSPSLPLNNYSYSGGILTVNFTTDQNQALISDDINGIVIGNYYKLTVKIRKVSNLGGSISIGFSVGTGEQPEDYARFSPTTTEATYSFIIKAVTYRHLLVGTHRNYNKGETYIISEIKIENANATDGYITEAAKKIVQLESAYNPTITDLQSYITENAGKDIFIPAGTYVCDNLTIPNGTRLHGIAGATTLQLTNGATSIINLTADSSDITIDGIKFVGNNDMSSISSATAMSLSDLRARNGEGSECGIYMNGFAKKIFIQNCEFARFSLAGIRLYRMHTSAMYVWKVKITDCHFTNNWYGLLSDVRSEYHTIMGCSFNYNQIGAFVAGGNNTFSECRFEANGTGFVVSGTAGENDSHGSAGTCSFNHNKGYGIAIIDINNGYSFTGCHVFDGTGIIISNSIGFNYVGGMVACKIIVDSERNAGYNMFAEDIFTTTYNSGTIEGNPTKLSLHGNRFLTQNDCSSINNEI